MLSLFLLSALAIVDCRYITYGLEDNFDPELSLEEAIWDFDKYYQGNAREKRQIHGSGNTNSDGSSNLNLKIPVTGNDRNILSAVGSVQGAKGNGGYGAAGGGLALDNVNGHGASLTGRHIPGFGDQLTGAAHANIFTNQDHKLGANAFATRTMPNSNLPDFNTYGGGLDYKFKDRVGASLGVANTPLFQKQDYSAMGNLNLFKTPSSSLDLNAGFSKSVSPYIPNHSWQPSGNVIFTKYW